MGDRVGKKAKDKLKKKNACNVNPRKKNNVTTEGSFCSCLRSEKIPRRRQPAGDFFLRPRKGHKEIIRG